MIDVFANRDLRNRDMAALALAFTILTAARSCEVLGMAWSEVDMEAATWTVPASRMKMKREHRVPVSTAALDILRSLPRTESPHVFFGRLHGRGQRHSMLRKALRRLGRSDITVHGFRSTFRDWCADTGRPSDIGEAALAHVTGNATVQAYARSDLLERRRALMEAWGEYLTRPPAEVVPIRTPTTSAAA